MNILGISTMTESAATLLTDGRVAAAAEEERFSRIKHSGGVPYGAIEAVLRQANVVLRDIDVIAVAWDRWNITHRAANLLQAAVKHPAIVGDKMRRAADVLRGPEGNRDGGWVDLFRLRKLLSDRFGIFHAPIRFLDHHACHMATAFFGSGFERAAVLVMDGAGESACTSWATGELDTLQLIDEHLTPHSLGHFYSAITGYLGFRMLDGEYKVMGLSAYADDGDPSWIRQHFLRSVGDGRYRLEADVLDYHAALRGHFAGAFRDHFGEPRHDDASEVADRHKGIAAAAQRAFEEVVLDMARALRSRTGHRKLAIAGGCALNCVANGRIVREGIFDQVYVPPVPNDAGGALGAAMLEHVNRTGQPPAPIDRADFGPSYSEVAIRRACACRGDISVDFISDAELVERTARLLSQGSIVGWMQGGMEYGARALGNRSFLVDPRHPGVAEEMNLRIKRREPFRPFAPSVKAEKASDWFELGQESPFMSLVVPVRSNKRQQVPAIVHVDGSSRPQTVARDRHPLYWSLLDRFEFLTGVPLVLNTSFNIQEPIVCTPDQAIETFARSGAHALMLGNAHIVHKSARTYGSSALVGDAHAAE